MKRLLIFVIVGIAAWIAWQRGPGVFEKQPQHDVVVKNNTGSPITRLRVTVGGQTFVSETLAPGASATWSFRVQKDSPFKLVWEWGNRLGEKHWTGGRVPHGPLVQVHTLRINPDEGVVYHADEKREEPAAR